MGTEQHGKIVVCVLCKTSYENPTTGPLSTKDDVTAHENCLLYSSGIICQNSPEFDDLFGFTAEDVLMEVKRGNRLICHRCKKKGATVGCEVKRCKKSYHYPCAVQDGAQIVDDRTAEKYMCYCQKHYLEMAATNGTVSKALSCYSGSDKEMNNNGETSPKEEERFSLEHIASGIVKLYCEKQIPQSLQKELNGLDAVAGPSSHNGDADMSSKRRQKQTPKRRLSPSNMLYCEKQKPQSLQKELNGLDAVAGPSSHNSDADMSSKRRQKQTPKRRLSPSNIQEVKSSGNKRRREDFLDSDGYDMELAPLESDLEDSENSEHRNHAEAPTTDTTCQGSRPELENGDYCDSDDTVIDSDAESQSLLLPVNLCVVSEEPSQGTSLSVCSPQPFSAACPGSPVLSDRPCNSLTLGPAYDPILPVHSTDHSSIHSGPLNVTSTPTRTSPTVSPVPPDYCFTPVSSPPSPSPHSVTNCPPAGPGGPGSLVGSDSDSTASRVFWKRCNQAGCTESIFTTFIADMVSISNRILSDKATQEDYDLSLRVMKASGKLLQMLSEQEREFMKKQMELQEATVAIRKARSALKREAALADKLQPP